MVLWPAVSLVGFLLITGLVVLMGTHSTARYEQERRAAAPSAAQRTRSAASDAIGVAAVL